MPPTRQLAAIMFTDIVGYTALMGKDEHRALELLNKNRQLQKPIIEAFNGWWIKELGDGVMASFTTVSDAVNAALKIQQQCNAAKECTLRIGIHLGEVIVEENDVFGDGVNIASRIQSIAEPGGIFVSETVHHNISNKQDFRTRFVKEERLKNVREPVRIYQVIAAGIATAPQHTSMRSLKKKAGRFRLLLVAAVLLVAGYFIYNSWISRSENGKTGSYTSDINEKSIAILPFTDMSPEKDQEYLCKGLAEEIINSITMIRDLKVIGRHSISRQEAKITDAQTIGKEFNVGLVLEGSVQKSGNVLRITTQLIRVSDNATLWSHRFDKEFKDIFAIQDSIAGKIVEELQVTLSGFEKTRMIKKQTDPETYELYLKGLHTYLNSEFDKSIGYHLQVIGRDSLFAPAWAYLALAKAWIINRTRSFNDYSAIAEAREFARKSIHLDPDLAEGYSALALIAWSIDLDFTNAKLNFEKSIQLNPSASLVINRYCYFLLWMGELEKAEQLGLAAIRADPADYNGYVIVASSNMFRQRIKVADRYIEEGVRLFPETTYFQHLKVRSRFYAGDYDSVIQLMKQRTIQKTPGDPEKLYDLLCIAHLKKGNRSASEALLQQLKEKQNDSGTPFYYAIARVYAQYRQADSCFRYLELSFQAKETGFRLFKIDPLLGPVKKDSRYNDLYHRYGFDRYK